MKHICQASPLAIICDHPSAKSQGCRLNGSRVMSFFLVPDRQTDGQKATPKSPPCISTGGLNNIGTRVLPHQSPKIAMWVTKKTHCPPSGRSSPMILSWGFRSAVYAEKLAGLPDRVCTLTPHCAGSRWNAVRALSWHRLSMASTYWAPP